jgi:hypothetical protein
MTEIVEPCTCGKSDVEVKAEKSGFRLYWWVRCAKCGRESCKHTTPDGAVYDWNRMGLCDGSES